MQINTLWDKFREGDATAFETIYNSHIDELLAYGNHFTKDKSLIEDCIHDLFVRLYERKDHLNAPKSIKAYLYSSLRREILNRGKQKEMPKDEIHESLFDLDIDIEQSIIKSELSHEHVEMLQRSLNSLSDRQREVVFLSFYNNLSHDEISEVLGINNQSVRNLLSQGLKRMRDESNLSLTLLLMILIRF